MTHIAKPKHDKTKKTAPKLIRCAIYARVSVADQIALEGGAPIDAFTSTDSQKVICREFIASQRGWVVAEEYTDDGRSGKDTKRPDFQRMLRDIKAGHIDAVVVHRVDRFSRSLTDFLGLIEEFSDRGTIFASATQPINTFDEATGKWQLSFLIMLGQLERQMTSDRVRDKIVTTRKQGLWSGGSTPMGYRYEDKRLVPDKAEAATLRMAFEHIREHRSIRKLTDHLNAKHAVRKARKRNAATWAARPWTATAVVSLLRNPVCTGHVPLNGTLVKGKHEAIIPLALFEEVGVILDAQRDRASRKEHDPRYVLQGLLSCGCKRATGDTCNSAMTPAASRKQRDAGNRFYRCVRRLKGGKTACPSRTVGATPIESFVAERMQVIATEGEVTRKLRAFVTDVAKPMRSALKAEIKALPAQIGELAEKESALMATLEKANNRTYTRLVTQLTALSTELESLESRLAKAQRKLTTIDELETDTAWLTQQLEAFGGTWETLTDENKNLLIRRLVRSVVFDQTAQQVRIVFSPLDAQRALLLADTDDAQAALDACTVEVSGPVYRVRKRRRVAFSVVADPVYEKAVRPARIARHLAIAHHIRRAIEAGSVVSYREISIYLDMSRARLTQIMDLTLLAPDIQEALLGLQAIDSAEPAINEHALRHIAQRRSWIEQRQAWAPIAKAAGINQRVAISPQTAAVEQPKRP
jgi:site-specific DNA recombinase